MWSRQLKSDVEPGLQSRRLLHRGAESATNYVGVDAADSGSGGEDVTAWCSGVDPAAGEP
jgi:hypothetical protein